MSFKDLEFGSHLFRDWKDEKNTSESLNNKEDSINTLSNTAKALSNLRNNIKSPKKIEIDNRLFPWKQESNQGKIDGSNIVSWVQNGMDRVTIQTRENDYLEKYETMNESQFHQLFSWKEKLQQWQIGDCYLVSWIHELARAQHFDTLTRTSMQRVKRKNGDKWYQIKIPLWEPSWRKIVLKDSEIDVAKIKWNTWYKLLELAYAKNKLRKNDKQWNKYSPITPWEFSGIKWWWTKEVLESFLWKHNIKFNTFGEKKRSKSLEKISENEKRQIIWFLRNYSWDIWNRFVSLSSIWWKSDTKQYKVWWKTIYHNHAYALTWVNKDSSWNIKSIKVLNPRNRQWDWKNYQDFTIDEFFQAFSYMSCGKLNTKEFLNDE